MIHIQTILDLDPVRINTFGLPKLTSLLLGHHPRIVRDQLIVIDLGSTMLFTQRTVKVLGVVVVMVLVLVHC